MIFLWLALGFAAASLASWLLLFPSARDWLWQQVAGVWTKLSGKVAGGGRRVAAAAQESGRAVRAGSSGFAGLLERHRLVLLAAVVLLCVPIVLVLTLRRNVVLHGFGGEDLGHSRTMIAELLRGERLVPPPAPPPEVFVSEEVRRLKPEVVTADRKWDRLDPRLQQRVLAIYQVLAEQHGIRMVLVEGYRSPERQAELMREGRATNAGAWQSCHQYGLALDSAPLRDGKLQWDMGDTWTRRAYFLYGELAEEAGLTWGGRWRMGDFVHVEMGEQCKQARRERAAASG